ncbi:MAG TPA: DUF4394 domain-containing protein, partial [Xanthomonadales bacterium]|nr:DUF4394 domain-containing protein [Xanthomonadales bacterium]
MPHRARYCLVAAALLAPLPASALTAYALNAAGTSVVRFDTRSPGSASSLPIAGLLAGETLLSLDFRPRTRTLYAVSSANRVLIVEPGFAFVTPVGGAFTPALAGTLFDMDFNASTDRIRVVSDADQDLRLDPATGAVAGVDTALQYAPADPNAGADPNVVGVAHTASFAGASMTTLFDIDSGTDVLATQVPANVGTLNTVGPLGVGVVAAAPAGFDMLRAIDGTEVAFAALSTTGTSSTLFRINLATGAATAIGAIGTPPQLVRGLALRDDEEPDAFVVTASNQLVRFNLASPGVIASPLPIVGLQPGETLRCLDWRPRTQQLVAIGTTDRLYSIQPETGF